MQYLPSRTSFVHLGSNTRQIPAIYSTPSDLTQHSSATPVQKIITVEKSISIDLDSLSRNSKYQSKELYTWGQQEPEDLKDGTLPRLLSQPNLTPHLFEQSPTDLPI